MNGFEFNIAAVFIAQILAQQMSHTDMALLANFMYTVADCMNTIIDADNL
jgi:hypothetical protein